MNLLIKGADLIGAGRQDVLTRDDMITQIGTLDAGSQTIDQTIEAGGLIALTGLVDIHTHLREPGREDAEPLPAVRLPQRSAACPRSWPWPTRLRSPTPQKRPSAFSTSAGWPLWSTYGRSAQSPKDSPGMSLPSSL